MNNFIAVTVGDIKGIGIELLIDLYKKKKIDKFILFTNYKIFKNELLKRKIKIKINILNKESNKLKLDKNNFNIYNYKADTNNINSLLSLKNIYIFNKKNLLKGIITLPLNKFSNKKVKKDFIGHTEYFEKIDKKNISNMIFVKKNLIVTTLTTHIKLKEIDKYLLKKNYIYNKIISLNKTLIEDFKIKDPKLLISGINPHAGENGLFGSEENKLLKPIIKKLKKNIKIKGPISGDSMLINSNRNKFDCFIFNFHDQALIPFKLLSNYEGINFTSGLSVLRVSPDHGTAYDLVGKSIAKSKSLHNCFKFIIKASRNRKNC